MSYAEGTPERALQLAQQELSSAVEKVARLNGRVPEGFYVQDWVVLGSASKISDDPALIMFVIPGTPMATYQLHGLIDLADRWLVLGENDYTEYEPDDTGEDGEQI